MRSECLERALQVLKIAVLAQLAVLLFEASALVRATNSAVRELPAVLREEMTALRHSAVGEIRTTRSEVLTRADRITRSAEAGLGSFRNETIAEIAELRSASTRQLDLLGRTAASELTMTGAGVRQMVAAYAAAPSDFKYATAQIWDCEANPDCFENRYVSLSRALESASRSVGASAPRIAASLERTAVNSDRTAAESAALMKNLSDSFKPLPKWMRLPLQIAVPAAQLATPLVLR